MSTKEYGWSTEGGAILEDHSKKKHQILERYFEKYLETRCINPMQHNFRIAIVDGFSGAGFYSCSSPGSPIIFIRTLANTIRNINLKRKIEGIKTLLKVDCLLILNDLDPYAINLLKASTNKEIEISKQECPDLTIRPYFYNKKFEELYPQIKQLIIKEKHTNVFFNLDQCGYSHIPKPIISDIINSWRSVEILLTFMVASLLAFLSKKTINSSPLDPILIEDIENISTESSKTVWLANAEKTVFEHLKDAAPYSSPFAINNPTGWKYWLMHFARSFKARQVYNNVLHELDRVQIHAGRPGLEMFSYDPRDEYQTYLFDHNSREDARNCLHDDIPRFISAHNNNSPILMSEFYESIYNETPAHSDDIHEAILNNPDLMVLTDKNKPRRKASTIRPTDTLHRSKQLTFFSIFHSNLNK